MDKKELEGLFYRIQKNRRALDACPRHLFENVEIKFGSKAQCSVCGGHMDLGEVTQYVRGYIAAGKPASDVFPDWDKPLPAVE